MIGIRQIDHINLNVKALDPSIDFYRETFGFQLVESQRSATGAWAILGITGAAFLALHEDPDTADPGVPWLNHWGFVVTDMDATLKILNDTGVPRGYDKGSQDGVFHWPHSRSVYILDPDGHEIELAERFGGGLLGPPA